MKLLKIKATGLPLFADTFEIDFVAMQRVNDVDRNEMSNLFRNFYQNNVITAIGINASGKTSMLKVIVFSMRLLNNEPINSIPYHEILGTGETIIENYFLTDNQEIGYLRTVIGYDNKYFIKDEALYLKPCKAAKNKKSICDFSNEAPINIRNVSEQYLLDDVSIIIAFNKKECQNVSLIEMLFSTNINQLLITDDFPLEIVRYFDSTVEYLRTKKNRNRTAIYLKFYNQDEIILNKPEELNQYLSSGTIKGINVFVNAISSFKNGGYLIIDELENHFNKEIVSTLFKFYQNNKVNPHGAMLIFTTHYSELLDNFNRNDNVYIVRNNNGITVNNLSQILGRNDIKKSEVYQSGYLGGTTPVYDLYIDLKNVIIENVSLDNEEA
ncbi:MAG: ATP-binding protein [Lachnospiraceae bacterium]|nr:ATP-binding protein [Lachnospiraceae bacterium]